MKDRIVLYAIIAAGVSFLIGLIGKFTGAHIFVANATWHAFTQTCLLFAIAWRVGKGTFAPGESAKKP